MIDETSTEDLPGGYYPAVRYYPPEGELFLDIMTRLGEFATYERFVRSITPMPRG